MGIFSKKDSAPKKTKEEIKKEKEEQLKIEEEKKQAENERQVELAYRFLIQPNLTKVPDYEKKAFLRKKGLNTEQIEKAFKKRDDHTLYEQKTQFQPQQIVENNTEVNKQQSESKPSQEQEQNKVDTETLEQKLERAYKNGFLSHKNSKITELDSKIFEVQNLKTLVASQNIIKEIPSLIGNLVNLRIAQFSECGLTDDRISDKLFSLPNLVELNLSKNKITSINLIVNLPELQRLDLSDNDIVELPDDIDRCQKLQLLNVKNNHITFFPHNFTKLANLKRIVITGNKFEKEAEIALEKGGVDGLYKFLSQ